MRKGRIAAFAAAAVMVTGFCLPVTPKYSPVSYNTIEAEAASKTTKEFVTRMYEVVLGRKPDSKGLQNWTNSLNSRKSTASDIVLGFFFSDEYKGKKKSSSAMINDCYKAMLDRSPDQSGQKTWSSRFEVGMTIEAICKGFVGSDEFAGLCKTYGISPGTMTMRYARDENYERTSFVYRLYKNCLGRNPDTDGLENWCKNLKNGKTGTSIAQGFIFSDEYKKKNTSNAQFVDMLYKTILGRNADSTGASNWTKQLNNGSSRAYVTNGFLFSDEFKGQCAKAGITLGNKLPAPEDDPVRMYADKVVSLVNAERRKAGVPELKTYTALTNAADKRSKEIAESFSHSRPDGRECFTVLKEYSLLTYYSAGENIAMGYPSPEAVMEGWMNSSGHRKNILDPDFEYIGVGLYEEYSMYYWTQLFIG